MLTRPSSHRGLSRLRQSSSLASGADGAGRIAQSPMAVEVSWAEATWVSSIVLAIIITVVGIGFFSLLILTSIRCIIHTFYCISSRILNSLFFTVFIGCAYCKSSFGISGKLKQIPLSIYSLEEVFLLMAERNRISFISSFLNLFLLFGAVFAFPAVVINSVFVTAIYAYDLNTGFSSYSGRGSLIRRYFIYLLVAVLATILGACFIKYTPGILHKYVHFISAQ